MIDWARIASCLIRAWDEFDDKWVIIRRYIPDSWDDNDAAAQANGRVYEYITCNDGSRWQIVEIKGWDWANDPKAPEGLAAIDIWAKTIRPGR